MNQSSENDLRSRVEAWGRENDDTDVGQLWERLEPRLAGTPQPAKWKLVYPLAAAVLGLMIGILTVRFGVQRNSPEIPQRQSIALVNEPVTEVPTVCPPPASSAVQETPIPKSAKKKQILYRNAMKTARASEKLQEQSYCLDVTPLDASECYHTRSK